MTVVALDPGKETGVAYVGAPADLGSHCAFGAPSWKAVEWVHATLERGFTDLVVCESIRITAATAKKSQDVLISVEQIGAVRYLCHLYGTDFKLQDPSEGKGFGTDRKLRALGWWTRGNDHARDASRHLLTAICDDPAVLRQVVDLLESEQKEDS